jgi:hypothetical protein
LTVPDFGPLEIHISLFTDSEPDIKHDGISEWLARDILAHCVDTLEDYISAFEEEAEPAIGEEE